MAYIYPNFKTKKAAKEAIAKGEKIICKDNTPWGHPRLSDGMATVEGPHYPEPHRWYGKVTLKDGQVIKLV